MAFVGEMRAEPRLQVAAIQPNIPQREKFDPQFAVGIFEKLSQLSEIAAHTVPPPDLLVWPESAVPDLVHDELSEGHRFVMEVSGATKTDLLLGGIDAEDRAVYNAALLVPSSDEEMQVYRKRHLVPFGEYVPLRHSFPPFGAIAGQWVPSDFNFGEDYTLFRLTKGDVLVAPLICFEDTVGELARQFVLKGANLFVDVTNDGWFLHSVGSRQHLSNAIFRCVETRRPMVRAANTGVTCFINEFGRVTEILRDDAGSTFTEGVLTSETSVPARDNLTFYTRHGEVFAQTCAVISILIVSVLGLVWIRRKSAE